MPSFADLLAQGTAHAWLFVPSAILLGVLHGLEPGHSKTMMAAFIVAIRGTVGQAVMLGLAATVSHTAVVWAIALGGLYLWQGLDVEAIEPYFQIVSAAVILAVAGWMIWTTWRGRRRAEAAHGHAHSHDHGHGHEHDHGGKRRIDTGHGVVALEVFEGGGPSRFRVRTESGVAWRESEVTLVTERANGAAQRFAFADRGDYLESLDEIAEPHEFMARVALARDGHVHAYDFAFVEAHAHGDDPIHRELRGLAVAGAEYQDAHELAHANDIRRRFADGKATNGQILLFGLTGGLIPCPASVTVLLLCLQLKQIALGATLVLCFSIGLAATLVAVGAAAALSVKHAATKASWFADVARRAPYLSGGLMILVGLYVAWQGIAGLSS